MFPTCTAGPLSTADLATSALPLDVGLRDAHATTNRALTALGNNPNQHPYPPSPLRALPSLSLLRLVSASYSAMANPGPVGWMASVLPPQLTVPESSPSLGKIPCLPSMLCLLLTLAMEQCSLPPS